MSENDFQDIAQYFSNLVRRYGHNVRACDWGSARSQQVRFDILTAAASLDGKKLLDVGCGFADLYAFLTARNVRVEYHGIDLSQEMVDVAIQVHSGISVERKNVLDLCESERYDVVIANGIFYRLVEDREATMLRLITKLFALADEVVAFNSLSTWAEDPQPGEFYADPLVTLKTCTSLTSKIVLRHDYHPRDFTLYLYR